MSDMTVSQALRQTKKIKGKIAELTARASQSVSYKLGHEPAFGYQETVDALGKKREELVELETRVAVTNATTAFEFDGVSRLLTWAVRRLQELKSEIAWLRGLPVRSQMSSTEKEIEYAHGGHVTVEVSWKCELPEAARSAKADSLQEVFDRLNDAVERVNHATPLRAA